ncbi:hypothetical protein KJ688_17275 [bacterium]|nr:hypothetical protein [bacterium]
MKLLVRFRLFLILPLITSLSGQSLTVLQEYKTDIDLIDVIVLSDTNSIEPQLFIHSNQISDAKTGKIVSEISARQSLVVSEHHRLLGIFSPEKAPSNRTEPRQFGFTVYSAKDHPDFTIHDKYIDTGKRPAFFLNEAKGAAMQISPNGDRIKFYDNHGRLLREKPFSQNLPHNYETTLTAFSADGNRLAFFTRIFNMEDNQMIPMLYLLSPIGEEIWKARLILKRIDALEIAESGQSVAVAGQTFQPVGAQAQNHIFVFNGAGVIQNSLPYRAIKMAFNNSEKQLLIRDEQTVKIIDLNSEGVVISNKVGDGRREIADMDFLNDSTFILSIGTVKFSDGNQIYDSPEIQLYSTDGKLLAKTDFPNAFSHNATIFKSLSGNQTGICLQNKFIVLQVTQKN